MVDSVFVPNKKYKLRLELEQARKRGPVATSESKRLFYGATYLFDAIGENAKHHFFFFSYLSTWFSNPFSEIRLVLLKLFTIVCFI